MRMDELKWDADRSYIMVRRSDGMIMTVWDDHQVDEHGHGSVVHPSRVYLPDLLELACLIKDCVQISWDEARRIVNDASG
jgi:hypothetical protein